jgi:hypothetical protein
MSCVEGGYWSILMELAQYVNQQKKENEKYFSH